MRTRTVLSVLLGATACVVAAGTVVGLSATPVTAAEHHAVAVTTTAVDARRAAERLREASGVRDQVVSGHLGPDLTPSAAAAQNVVTFAYAGDSITARPGSWLHDLAATDPRLEALGGYAHSGYRSDQVLADVGPDPEAVVLVVELGTNDVNQARPDRDVLRDIAAVVTKVDARHVLLVAEPPSDHTTSLWGVDRRAGSARLNGLLVADARAHGWTFADPFAGVRLSDNAYVPGTSDDGIHPTTAANVSIARAFAAAIDRAAA